jgi:hypothetical protein
VEARWEKGSEEIERWRGVKVVGSGEKWGLEGEMIVDLVGNLRYEGFESKVGR